MSENQNFCSVPGCTRAAPYCRQAAGSNSLAKPPKRVKVPGTDMVICAEMSQLVVDQVNYAEGAKKASEKAATDEGATLTPKGIAAFIRERVWGQDKAVEVIANALYHHTKNRDLRAKGVEMGKSNVLLAGSTGVGKTLIMQTGAQAADMPFYIYRNLPGVTKAGYVGKDVDDIIKSAFPTVAEFMNKREPKSGDDPNNVAKFISENGMVLGLDEVDKIAADKGRPGDVGGESVQDALLTIIEGTELPLQFPGPQPGSAVQVVVDTTNIMFMLAGAFMPAGADEKPADDGSGRGHRTNLRQIITKRRRGAKKSVGDRSRSATKVPKSEIYLHAVEQDFVSFGLKPEFVGRIYGYYAPLRDLSTEDLIKILTEVKGNVADEYKHLMSEVGRELGNPGYSLEFMPEALELIAKEAARKGTGARALRNEMSKIFQKVLAVGAELNDTYDTVVVTPTFVETMDLPVKTDEEGKTRTDADGNPVWDTDAEAWPFSKKKGSDSELDVLDDNEDA